MADNLHPSRRAKTLKLWERLHDDQGFSLIPLIGKDPFETNWQHWCVERRTFTAEDFNGCNAGICTGPASGIIALDIDDMALFKAYAQEHGYTLPVTREHTTGRGKIHKLYKYPSNGNKYGNRSFKKHGFDIRGIGGQIVAPGSIHPGTGCMYELSMDVPIADAPEWLLKLALHEEEKEPIQTPQLISIDDLPVSIEVKCFLKNNVEKGQRSELFFKALCSLVGINLPVREITNILESHPGGEKYREKGTSRHKWLQDEIRRARNYIASGNTEHPQTQRKGATGFSLNTLDECYSQPVSYIYGTHIPAAMPFLIGGREGSGKTTIVIGLINEILKNHPGDYVVFIASEGFLIDVVDKMKKLGTDTTRVLLLRHPNETFQFSFDRITDRNLLDNFMAECRTAGKNIILVVIDSIRGISQFDDNDSKIKNVMLPLNSIVCDKHGAALGYIDHFKKGESQNTLDKLVGTTAKGAAVRRVFGVLPVSAYTRKIVLAKSNILGSPPPDLMATLSPEGLTLYEKSDVSDVSMTAQAEQFLIRLFSEKGTYKASEIYELGEAVGLNSEILKKAKQHLDVRTHKTGGVSSPWMWSCETFLDI